MFLLWQIVLAACLQKYLRGKKMDWQIFFGKPDIIWVKFIYIMDAFEDLPEDTHKERFNPYLGTDRRELLPQVEEQLLTEIAAAGAAFEKLPCLEYRDIMRNILYAGVWNRFDRIKQELQKEEQ